MHSAYQTLVIAKGMPFLDLIKLLLFKISKFLFASFLFMNRWIPSYVVSLQERNHGLPNLWLGIFWKRTKQSFCRVNNFVDALAVLMMYC